MIHTNITVHEGGKLLRKVGGPEISVGDTLMIDGKRLDITQEAKCRPHPKGNAWSIPQAGGGFLAIAEVLE